MIVYGTRFFSTRISIWAPTRTSKASGLDPVVHYLLHGATEGRDPGPYFSETQYRVQHPDVAESAACALEHYEWRGRDEGRRLLGRDRAMASIASAAATIERAARFAERKSTVVRSGPANLRQSLERLGLFDPQIYLGLNEDLRLARVDAWSHFLDYGISEGRPFTTPELVARALSQLAPEIDKELIELRERISGHSKREEVFAAAAPLVSARITIGVYCNSRGNVFLQEIANLVHWQLTALGVNSKLRTEDSPLDERLDIRIFIAPHEFYLLGRGDQWRRIAGDPGTILYNTEQAQTKWFNGALPYLIKAPLVLDLNFQTAKLSRYLGCNSIYYMPPYLGDCPYTSPQLDVSHIDVVRGYDFSSQSFDWKHKDLHDRPIDILFIGSSCERRVKALERLRELSDKYRFVCIYTHQTSPLSGLSYRTTSPEINCALAQRSKIVLSVHRDWIGYFEWSRMVMQGFWQGACVVSDPSFPDPVFIPGIHFLEEPTRHLAELIDWLLGTQDGRAMMTNVAAAGHRRARSMAARAVALKPMLTALQAAAGDGRIRS